MKPVTHTFTRSMHMVIAITCALASWSALSQETAPAGDQKAAREHSLTLTPIAGDHASNILKIKSATAPIITVQDESGSPVSGVLVHFELPRDAPSATFVGGAKEASVTTDASGQACAPRMQPVGKGSFAIRVSAKWNGSEAGTTVHQTNYRTEAEARSNNAQIPGQYANGLTSGKKIALTTAIVGGAAAAAGIAVAGRSKTGSHQDCTPVFNTFFSDLNIANNTYPIGSPQWMSAMQTMFNAMGSYCSCAGGPGLLASDPSTKQDTQNLISAGSNAGFAVPASCGSF